MTSYLRSACGKLAVAAFLPLPVCFAAGPRPAQTQIVQAQAQLLDHAAFLCDDCFFGASTYYYCFEADNQILAAYQRTRVMNYTDESKNYLTSVHHGWAVWDPPAGAIPIRYDAKHIWVSRPDGNQANQDFWAHLKAAGRWLSRNDSQPVRLTRSPLRDIFVHDARCRPSTPKAQ